MAYAFEDNFYLFEIVYYKLKSDRITHITPVTYAGRSLFEHPYALKPKK